MHNKFIRSHHFGKNLHGLVQLYRGFESRERHSFHLKKDKSSLSLSIRCGIGVREKILAMLLTGKHSIVTGVKEKAA